MIPCSAEMGSASFAGLPGPTQTINLIGDGAELEPYLPGSNPDCICCFGICALSLSPSPLRIPVQNNAQSTATATYNSGSKTDVTSGASWSSNNTPIATVTSGLVSGVSPGSVTITATIHANIGGACRQLGQQCPSSNFGGGSGGTVEVLGSFAISVTSTPVPGETNSVVSGQSAQVQVTALDQTGATFTGYRGTAHFSSTDTLAALPGDYTYTSSDAGVHTFTVTLKTVSGTSATRDLTVSDQAAGVSDTDNIDLWFQVTMDVEFWKNCCFTACPNLGSYFCQTAYGSGYSQPTAFISLTYSSTSLKGRTVVVRAGSARVTAFVGDAGPSTNSPYWNTGTPPPGPYGCVTDFLSQELGVQSFGCTSSGCSSACTGSPCSNGAGNNAGSIINPAVLWRFGS